MARHQGAVRGRGGGGQTKTTKRKRKKRKCAGRQRSIHQPRHRKGAKASRRSHRKRRTTKKRKRSPHATRQRGEGEPTLASTAVVYSFLAPASLGHKVTGTAAIRVEQTHGLAANWGWSLYLVCLVCSRLVPFRAWLASVTLRVCLFSFSGNEQLIHIHFHLPTP